jgi:hypothetical protein
MQNSFKTIINTEVQVSFFLNSLELFNILKLFQVYFSNRCFEKRVNIFNGCIYTIYVYK